MGFNGYSQFDAKLLTGNKLEALVKVKLEELLPSGYTVKNTPQDPGCPEREQFNLCDVVVFKDGTPVFGVECKVGEEKFRKCEDFFGWDGDYNTPLNGSSLNEYKVAAFPFYVLNGNTWCGLLMAARMDEVLATPHSGMRVDYKGNPIYNFDCRKWHQSKSINNMLKYIISKELC